MPFTSSIRRKLVRGAPAHLKGFVLSLFLVPDLSIGDASAQLDELNSMLPPGPCYLGIQLNPVNLIHLIEQKHLSTSCYLLQN